MTLFNYVPYDFIGHLTFQMRKVLVAGNSNEATRYSLLGEGWVVDSWAQDYLAFTSKQTNIHDKS